MAFLLLYDIFFLEGNLYDKIKLLLKRKVILSCGGVKKTNDFNIWVHATVILDRLHTGKDWGAKMF